MEKFNSKYDDYWFFLCNLDHSVNLFGDHIKIYFSFNGSHIKLKILKSFVFSGWVIISCQSKTNSKLFHFLK